MSVQTDWTLALSGAEGVCYYTRIDAPALNGSEYTNSFPVKLPDGKVHMGFWETSGTGFNGSDVSCTLQGLVIETSDSDVISESWQDLSCVFIAGSYSTLAVSVVDLSAYPVAAFRLKVKEGNTLDASAEDAGIYVNFKHKED